MENIINWKSYNLEGHIWNIYLLMTRKYLLTAHNDVYFSLVKYKVICALTLLWIGKREEPMQVQEKVPKGNDSERGLYLLPDITSHYFLICS